MKRTGGRRPLAWGPHKGRWDGCEWNPEQSRGSEVGDRHFAKARATVTVGPSLTGSIQYRLCASCAALPLFHSRVRRSIQEAA